MLPEKKMFQQWLNLAKMAKLDKMQYLEIHVSYSATSGLNLSRIYTFI